MAPFLFPRIFLREGTSRTLDERFSTVLVIADHPRSNREIASVPGTNYERCYQLLGLESAPNLEISFRVPFRPPLANYRTYSLGDFYSGRKREKES